MTETNYDYIYSKGWTENCVIGFFNQVRFEDACDSYLLIDDPFSPDPRYSISLKKAVRRRPIHLTTVQLHYFIATATIVWLLLLRPFEMHLGSYGHTRLKAPGLVRSLKLSKRWPGQYCGGRPRGNTGCCSFCISSQKADNFKGFIIFVPLYV